MQAFFWQQLDEEKMSEKKRRERREERSKKLEKRSKIIEYAKVVKFGNWYSIPSAEEKCQEPGKRRLAMSCEDFVFSWPLSMIKHKSKHHRGIKFRVPLEQIKKRSL